MNPGYEDIFSRLRDNIGLDPNSLGRASIRSIVDSQMARQGFTDPARYAAVLADSAERMQELVEAIVVPESWFFREPRAFERMLQLASGQSRSETFRVLCLPCAAGEEAYSIAISLLENGIENFQVDAYDISHAAIKRARRGHYGAYAFRGRPPEQMIGFLEAQEAGYAVASRVREKVHFGVANITEGLPDGGLRYHAIFCRNLLIYLSPEARQAALETFHRHLMEKGELFVAVCEAPTVSNASFQMAGPFFAFRARAGAPEEPRLRAIDVPTLKIKRPPKSLAVPRSAAGPSAQVSEARPAPPDPEQLLILARIKADAGELEEAARLCQVCLDERRSSEAYLLLGVIRAAQGLHDEARELLRRALYLDPKNREALLHMAVYAEQDGRKDIGAGLRQRAARAEQT